MAYNNIMAVYDGTAAADDLLDMVCRIARAHRARLTILHIDLVPLQQPLPAYQPGADDAIDALVAKGEKLADGRGVKAASAVRYARAVGAAVIAEARVRGIDLVALLVPPQDKLPPDRCLTTDIEIVLHRLGCSVLLCRPAR